METAVSAEGSSKCGSPILRFSGEKTCNGGSYLEVQGSYNLLGISKKNKPVLGVSITRATKFWSLFWGPHLWTLPLSFRTSKLKMSPLQRALPITGAPAKGIRNLQKQPYSSHDHIKSKPAFYEPHTPLKGFEVNLVYKCHK